MNVITGKENLSEGQPLRVVRKGEAIFELTNTTILNFDAMDAPQRSLLLTFSTQANTNWSECSNDLSRP